MNVTQLIVALATLGVLILVSKKTKHFLFYFIFFSA